MNRDEHLASLPFLDGMARAAFMQAWEFATVIERERCATVADAVARHYGGLNLPPPASDCEVRGEDVAVWIAANIREGAR